MGLRRLNFLLLLFFLILLSYASTLPYRFASAFSEERDAGEEAIRENDSTKTRLVGEIVVHRRGGAGGSKGGTGYSSNSAMNHGNNVDNKPSRRTSDSSTVYNLGLKHLGFLLLLSFVLV